MTASAFIAAPDAALTATLTGLWAAAAAGTGNGRLRDVAAQRHVSEAHIVACGCADGSVRRLTTDWKTLLEGLAACGDVMVLTRNEWAVHEKVGTFGNMTISPAMGLVLNRTIDLRMFLGKWAVAFAVTTQTKTGPRHSIQVFDAHGDSILKIFARDTTDLAAFQALTAAHVADDQTPGFIADLVPDRAADPADDAVDVDTLLSAWRGMTDVHQFHGIVKKAGVGRHQALRLAPEFAEEVQLDALRQVVQGAVDAEVPIMVFVGNRGNVQIHTGAVKTVRIIDNWFNIMDPGFTLHLREDGIASAWVVRKPHADGHVTSLELYDANGDNFCILFGERREGEQERDDWRALLAALPRRAVAQAAE